MSMYARGSVERIAFEALSGGQIEETLELITSRLFGAVDPSPEERGIGVRDDSTLSPSDGANGTAPALESTMLHLRSAIAEWVSSKLIPHLTACALDYMITQVADSFKEPRRNDRRKRTGLAIKGPRGSRSAVKSSSTLAEFLLSVAEPGEKGH
ncbi:MAG: hypothetical protein IH994_00005, partial [Proteobacteria bacterium]|nr:hypothetical protein [Pseudomonadota bacterium]